MAIGAVLDIARLEEGWVLAPERYDPRRRAKEVGPCLGDFVHVRRDQVDAKNAGTGQFLVLDTGDAKNGLIAADKQPVSGADIRSAKKRIRPRQVIISRLRPYLRQVAWVDSGLFATQEPNVEVLCSTEFFVLESVDDASIAFLAPFLLSGPVQAILAAAQEGGHHPRFNERTLTMLSIPQALVEQASEISTRFERAVAQARESFKAVKESIGVATCLHATSR